MTKKTVAYYEELVRQEIANRRLTRGLIFTVRGIPYMFLEKGDDKTVRLCLNLLTNQVESMLEDNIQKILGHEIRPHHILQWVKNRNGYSYISNGGKLHIEISPHNVLTITSRDPSKPFSEQSDDTKIALGKVVEEVLSCKDK